MGESLAAHVTRRLGTPENNTGFNRRNHPTRLSRVEYRAKLIRRNTSKASSWAWASSATGFDIPTTLFSHRVIGRRVNENRKLGRTTSTRPDLRCLWAEWLLEFP